MESVAVETRLAHARKTLASEGISQQDIAKAVSASQSQVSRALAGKSPKRSRVAKRIIAYLNGLDSTPSLADVRRQSGLMTAIAQVWDGSEEHAAALELVIRALASLAPRPTRLTNKRAGPAVL